MKEELLSARDLELEFADQHRIGISDHDIGLIFHAGKMLLSLFRILHLLHNLCKRIS